MRILIIKLTSMGDVLHTLPAISDLANAFPRAQIDWLVEAGFAEIPRWHPAIDKVIIASTRDWRALSRKNISSFLHFRRELRRQRYDYVIDAQGLFKSALLGKLSQRSKSGVICGFAKHSIRERQAAFFYDKKIDVDKSQHAILRVRNLFANALGYKFNANKIEYRIRAHFDADADTNKTNDERQPDYIVLFHGTTWPSKHISDHQWKAIITEILRLNLRIKITWGNHHERERALYFAKISKEIDVVDKSSLRTLATLLVNSKGSVAVDTGLAHLAAALGIPCVSVYGATNPSLTGTVGQNQVHLTSNLQCSPCLRKTCNQLHLSHIQPPQPPCYESIEVSRVKRSLMELV